MAPYKWRDSEVETFLKCYKQHECLWNINIPDYKDNSKKKRAYELLRNNLEMKHLTVQDVKNKIKGIRTTYNEELNKILNSQKSGDGGSNVYEPKVFWFKLADSFLRDVTEKKKSSPKVEEKVEKDLPIDREEDLVQEETKNEDDYEVTQQPATPDPSGKEFAQIEKAIDEVDDASKAASKRTNKEEDEFDFFGRSIAIQIKKLPELDALELMQQMQMMVIYKKRQILQSTGYQSSRKRTNVERPLRTPSPALSLSSSPSSLTSPQHSYTQPNAQVHEDLIFIETQINAISAAGEQQKDIAESATRHSQPHSSTTYKSTTKKARR